MPPTEDRAAKRRFHLEIDGLDEFRAFVEIIASLTRGQDPDDPALQKKLDAVTAQFARSTTQLKNDIAKVP